MIGDELRGRVAWTVRGRGAMIDYRDDTQRLVDAIMQTPQAEVDAYNAGRAHALSDTGLADVRWYEDDTAVGAAFWRGVQEGTASLQRLVDALGDDDASDDPAAPTGEGSDDIR